MRRKYPMVYFETPVYSKGPILLQTHGAEIRWRSLFIREIGAEEANQMLAARDADGFAELYNGKDLSKWLDAINNYEINDGAIVCKNGKGGDLLSKEEYEKSTRWKSMLKPH